MQISQTQPYVITQARQGAEDMKSEGVAVASEKRLNPAFSTPSFASGGRSSFNVPKPVPPGRRWQVPRFGARKGCDMSPEVIIPVVCYEDGAAEIDWLVRVFWLQGA